MNYTAGIIVVIGGAALLIGFRGTYKQLWTSATGLPVSGTIGKEKVAQTPASPRPGAGSVPQELSGLRLTAYNDAQSVGIDPTYFLRQINQESGWNPNAQSSAGAEGIAQFMPGTASGLGINPWNPIQALSGAARLMANYIRTYGGEAQGLAAYNAGPGKVEQALSQGKDWESYLPTETQNYIKAIMG